MRSLRIKLPLVELGQICLQMHQGINTAADKIDYSTDGYYILQSKHITKGFIDYSDARCVNADLYEKYKDKYRPKIGDILFCNIGTVGTNLVVKEDKNFLIAWNLFLLRPDLSQIYPIYLHYFLDNLKLKEAFNQLLTGGTVKFVNKKQLSSLKIPLPPLEEQHRIAAILDKADAIRRKRFEAIRLTEELLRAAFLDMFGDPVTNPKGWEMFALNDLVVDIESGWSPKCDFKEAGINEWGVLKLGAVTWGYFNDSENKALLPDTVPRPELEVKPGDLLFSRKNTYELVGASAFVHTTRPKLLLPDLIFRLCLKDSVNPVYLWQVLSQETMRTELSKLASGSAGSMPNISKARLRTLCLPVPPLEAQLRYYQIAKLFWKEQNHQKEFLQSSDKLFNSLLHRAFRGEL